MSNPVLTEILASYVPKLIQNRIVADPSPIESPVTEEMVKEVEAQRLPDCLAEKLNSPADRP